MYPFFKIRTQLINKLCVFSGIIKMYSRLAANILSISTLLKTHLKQIRTGCQDIRSLFLSTGNAGRLKAARCMLLSNDCTTAVGKRANGTVKISRMCENVIRVIG